MTQPISIAVIQQDPDIGGAETYMASLLKEFKQKECSLFVASNNQEFLSLVRQDASAIYTIPVTLDIIGNIRGLIKSAILLPFAMLFYLYLLFTLKRKKVDVLLMSGYSEKMLVTFLAPIFAISVVWIEHGPLENIFKRNFSFPYFIYKPLSKWTAHIIAPSNYTRNNLIKTASIPSKHISTIYDGVDVQKEIIKKQKTSDVTVIGCVSRLTKEKGQQVLIKSVAQVVKEYPHVQLHIIGRGPDEDYFRKLAKSLGIENNVQFKGFVENVMDEYKTMDIFVFPTLWDLEGFGLVAAEALSFGLPVIASDIGPVPEVIKHNQTGLLFPPGDEDILTKDILRLMMDPSLRMRLGVQGRKSVEERFTIKYAAELILTIIKDSITPKHLEKI